MNNRGSCKSCKYWDTENSTDGDNSGECRIKAPILVCGLAEFPQVYHFTWCGEHKPIKAEKPEGMSHHTWHESLREQDAIDKARKSKETT